MLVVRLTDLVQLIEGLEAEPRGAKKVWIQEPSTGRLIARITELAVSMPAEPPPPAPVPQPHPQTLLHGLDAQGWYDTARRYHVGLETIIKTEGHGIDHDWCRRQAAYYLRRVQDGSMVWQMPGAPQLHHIVVPDPALALPRRLQKIAQAPADLKIAETLPAAEPTSSATLRPGEAVEITIEVPRGDGG